MDRFSRRTHRSRPVQGVMKTAKAQARRLSCAPPGGRARRTIRFLEKMDCVILSGHRRVRPFGLAGGEAGQVGENSVRRNDGRAEKLEGCDATVINAGEAIIIPPPSAGGYGKPNVDVARS
jgi:N-methylhydantoinase B/oxoprolinase/acetone carboxylase alpha subunit